MSLTSADVGVCWELEGKWVYFQKGSWARSEWCEASGSGINLSVMSFQKLLMLLEQGGCSGRGVQYRFSSKMLEFQRATVTVLQHWHCSSICWWEKGDSVLTPFLNLSKMSFISFPARAKPQEGVGSSAFCYMKRGCSDGEVSCIKGSVLN